MYSKYQIYLRVLRICVILPIERVEKIRSVMWSVSLSTTNVMYLSISLIPRRYVIFVIATERLRLRRGRYRIWVKHLATIRYYVHGTKGRENIALLCEMYFFHVCYRTRRSAVKERPPAVRSAFHFFQRKTQPDTWEYSPQNFLSFRTKAPTSRLYN